MKTLKYLSVITVIIFISSCSITKQIEKSVIGKWKIISIQTDGQENITDAYKTVIGNLLTDSFIEFSPDNSYLISITGKEIKGNWSISEDGKKILTSESDNFFEIMTNSENKMTLKSVKQKTKVIMSLSKF